MDEPVAAASSVASAADSGAFPFSLPSDHSSPATAGNTENDATVEEERLPLGTPPDLTGKTVWVVDANSLIFQVFHAIPEMTSPRGEPVNALFGFTRDLLYLLEVKKPDYLFCAFDRPEPTFRHLLYDAYKSTRSETPLELSPQFPHIRRMAEALRIPIVEEPSFEADDVLATLARITEEQGGECFLVTGDKDARQLLSERVKIFNVRKNSTYDAAALLVDWGVRPDQVVDFQALVGDSVDAVPGVPQIGPKAAKELLDKFDTLDGVYARVEEITAAARKRTLIEHRDKAFLSRDLVRLEKHMTLPIDWNRARWRGIDREASVALCTEFGFHRITDQMRKMPAASIGHSPVPTAPAWKADYRTVATLEDLQALVAEMRKQHRLSVDTETTSVVPTRAEIVGYSFAWEPGIAYYVPVRAPEGEPRIDPIAAADLLRPVLEDPNIRKVGQNLKYDQIVLHGAGIAMQGVEFDTLIAAYLLDAGERNHNLDELAQRHLNHTNITIESLIGTGKNQKRMDEVPVPLIEKYAAEDADVALRLVEKLEPKLAEDGLEPLFHTVEMPLVEVLVDLERTGVKVDVARLATLSEHFTAEIARLEQEVFAIAGKQFNIASPKQLAEVLFVEQKLPILAKTKTGPSTDADVLEELALQHPLPAKIIEFRQFSKLKGTYVDALPLLVNPATGRVHCSLHQAVAATGRLSSSDPNLQNIPIRTDEGRRIRSAFLPGHDGWSLVSADYSQIELRLLAHCSEDPGMLASFAAGEDIHTRVASQVYGVPLEEVTRAQRGMAKTVNFGILYGQSAFGLSKVLGIPQEEAARFIEGYFAQYPGVERFMMALLVECAERGYVTTLLGRRRAIRGIRAEKLALGGSRQRNLAERTAINTVIQGSAADLIKQAMIHVYRRIKQELPKSRMLLQIHDELLFETPPEERDRLVEIARREMTDVMQLRVPLQVDVKIGKNWAETEVWE
ncbi:MAG: DNA polymerase I [Planctomycetia bacterium]|nr:DNA polymerase I [Planctomycetia bacterium]